MSRINALFAKKKPLIAYLTTGDGDTTAYARALIAGGADMLEIGVPFTDPTGDGPVIRRAMERALANKTSLADSLRLARALRKESEVPLVLFSYMNPLLAAGDALFHEAKKAGFDAVLAIDLPVEEAEEYTQACKEAELDPIFLLSPSTSLARLKKIDSLGSGFLYYVCQKGTTGVRGALPKNFSEKIALIKEHTNLPVVVGFGVSNQEMVQKIAEHADGVVVGSYFVQAIEEGKPPEMVGDMCHTLITPL